MSISIKKISISLSILTCAIFIITSSSAIKNAKKYNNFQEYSESFLNYENEDKKNENFLSTLRTHSQNNQISNEDLAIASSLLFNIKQKLLFINTTSLLDNNKIITITQSPEQVFVNGKLSEKASNEFNQFLVEVGSPPSEDTIKKYKKILEEVSQVSAKSTSQNDQSFINNLKIQEQDVSVLLEPQSIEINNMFRKNINNPQFQKLLSQQNIQALWDTYFKDKYGNDINTSAHLLSGTFKYKDKT